MAYVIPGCTARCTTRARAIAAGIERPDWRRDNTGEVSPMRKQCQSLELCPGVRHAINDVRFGPTGSNPQLEPFDLILECLGP
jgi:hypothetical protein